MRGSRNRIAALLLSGLVLAALAGPATAAADKLQGELDAIVGSAAGPPGIALLIDRGPRTRFVHAGVADLRTGAPPRANDRVRIASVSKAFSAYIAIALAREGKLGLNDTLGSRLPGLLPNAEAVTLRQLLQHTSGLPEYIRAKAFTDALQADPAAYMAPTQLTGFVREEPLEFAPGSQFHYSDTDNIAAALMEAAVSGRSYEQLQRREVFAPLAMRGSSLPRTVAMPRPFMRGYDVLPDERPEDVSELINPAGAWASGGIVSTPADLARFVPAYVPTILRATRGLAGAFRPGSSSPPGPGRNDAGLGIFRYRTGCGTVYGHTGSFPGYRLFVAGNAAGNRSVVFVANAQIVPGSGSQQISRAITRAQSRAVCLALASPR